MFIFTSADPSLPLLLFSITLSIGITPLLSSIILILPNEQVGTGLSVYKSIISLGPAYVDLISGKLQDINNNDYLEVMKMYLYISVIAFGFSFLYYILDIRKDGLLNVNKSEREMILNKRSFLYGKDQVYNVNITSVILTSVHFLLIILSWIYFIFMYTDSNK